MAYTRNSLGQPMEVMRIETKSPERNKADQAQITTGC
jgi:hypothetical protein